MSERRAFSQKERDVLYEAWMRCRCESYYRYRCSLCRMVGQGKHQVELKALMDMGLIEFGQYSSYVLTVAGQKLWDALERTQDAAQHP